MLDFNNGLDFKNGVNGFFHSLIPRKLRENLQTHEPEYIRVRALSALLFFSIVLLAIEITIVGGWHWFYKSDVLKYDLFALGIFALLGVQAILFYTFNNQWLSSLAFTSIYFLMVVILIIMSGGHDSSMKVLLLTCPFMAFLIGDKHEGIQTSILVAIIGTVLAVLKYIQFDTPDLFVDENPQLVFFVDWTIALIMIILSVVVYESALLKMEESSGIRPIHYAATRDENSVIEIIDRFIDALVPPLLRTTLPANSMAYVRVRFLSVMLLILLVMGILTIVPMIAGFWWFDPEPSAMLMQNIIIIVLWLVFVLQFWLFYRFGNYSLSSLFFTNSYFLVISAIVISSGGFDSPLKYFLLTCPLITFVICGVREGMQNALYTVIAGGALAGFKNIGEELPDSFTGNAHPYLVFSTNWILTVIIIMACITVYETELQRRYKKS